MGDQDHRPSASGLLAQAAEQLVSRRSVERGRRFVREEQLGRTRDRQRETGALRHTSRELEGVPADHRGRVGEAAGAQQGVHPVRVARSLGDQRPGAAQRGEGELRILEDHADAASAGLRHDRRVEEVVGTEQHRLRPHNSGFGHQPEQGPQQRALARSASAEHDDQLACAHVEVDAAQHLGVPIADPEVADAQHRHADTSCRAPSETSRRPSPIRVSASAASSTAPPGAITSHG